MSDDYFKRLRVLVSLLVATLQGAALYWLHRSIDLKQWPATDLSWIALFYAVATFAPLIIQLMGEYWRARPLWWATAGIAVAVGYFGWHYGNVFGPAVNDNVLSNASAFEHILCGAVLWFLFAAFLRCRLTSGRWASDYLTLFSSAWQNTLMLAEAAIFTGLFWALLGLWGALFKMLGYQIFADLFSAPEFAYPFTTLALGLGLYMTGSIERLVTVTREQILGLLKWLAPVAALILVLFTPTLLLKLPSLVFEGERAISAAWLLWLITFTVVLLNAGYQQGASENPYPPRLQLALRFVIPMMTVIAATAVYALLVRISRYGVSAERVYACVVAIIACIYAAGYTYAAVKRGPWLKGIERVNVAAAVIAMVILALLLTPIASPHRLAANSQLKRALLADRDERRAALRYLRFEVGRYGRSALQAIADGKVHSEMKGLTDDAKNVLAATNSADPALRTTPSDVIERIEVFPLGRSLEPALAEAIAQSLGNSLTHFNSLQREQPILAAFVDLNDDTVDECVVIFKFNVAFFARKGSQWHSFSGDYVASLKSDEEVTALRAALAAGNIQAVPPAMKDVRIGNRVFRSTADVTP